jgi:hypothetical protein
VVLWGSVRSGRTRNPRGSFTDYLFLPWSGVRLSPPGIPRKEGETMALKSVAKLRESIETPAKQAVTIAVVALVVALVALAMAVGGRK